MSADARASLLAPLKAVVNGAAGLVGLRISRVPKDVPPPVQARHVVNAHYRGHCFKCFLGDIQCEYILRGLGWDNQLDEILSALGDAPGDVVEIGANIGGSLVPRASEYPALTFHCYEPVPAFYALLSANAGSFAAPNVRLYNQAVTATDGEQIEIFTQLGTAGALANYDGHRSIDTVKLSGRSLDTLAKGLNVRFIKIDTDGFELSVLRGGERTLATSRPLIFMEFHVSLMRSAGQDPAHLVELLQRFGYRPRKIWDNFGNVLSGATSFDGLLTHANAAQYYVDVLLESP
jgi:FkbM family methyltransferase